MLEALQNFTLSLPEWARWAGVILISAIPFVESYFGSVIGIMAGIHPAVAIPAAVLGNTASMLLLVFGAHKLRKRASKDDESSMGPKKAKLKKAVRQMGCSRRQFARSDISTQPDHFYDHGVLWCVAQRGG